MRREFCQKSAEIYFRKGEEAREKKDILSAREKYARAYGFFKYIDDKDGMDKCSRVLSELYLTQEEVRSFQEIGLKQVLEIDEIFKGLDRMFGKRS